MLKGAERFISFDGRQIWCGIVGEPASRPPLVCIPGGPGMSHDYLTNLVRLTRFGRQVVFYDALGSGRSDRNRPGNAPWTQDVYIDEVAAVVAELGLARYHLFAASAAGVAAIPFALRQPPGLVSLILAGTPVNMAEHTRHIEDLLVELGLPRDEMAAFDAAPTLRAQYARIYHQFAAQYMCRIRPMPRVILRVADYMNMAANIALKGGRVFYSTRLRNWDITDRLGEITVPVLFTCGRHELLPYEVCQGIQRRLPRCELVAFERSGHAPHLDEPENYVARASEFLARHDPTDS